ncbi:copper homeostasis protein CutC [Enterococcus lemanii]|uniref:PF03932 family protein CutC n=1 Tax=Enterococcus lemanii TaxID=1159752 RepID=A0ABV9MUG7_9ENTE|nr:copper homeostasis protein CutC [Enterococcus lemanii]MBM7710147.1 copper homeostasis protein [Enterococcus lemanii]
MLKEFCAENFTDIPKAIEQGVKRIELCDNLTVGGTTPSAGVIETTVQYAHENNVTVMTIIRPRSGNFVYNDYELKIMETDLIEAKKYGTDGVVIGCLNEDGWLDEEALDVLIDRAVGLEITFHMAFDAMSKENQFKAIDWLVENVVDRILTHGGVAGTPIEDNFEHLKELIAYANGRIIILPGGGVNHANAQLVADALQVNEVHGTKIVSF